jgi:hypothetical protein
MTGGRLPEPGAADRIGLPPGRKAGERHAREAATGRALLPRASRLGHRRSSAKPWPGLGCLSEAHQQIGIAARLVNSPFWTFWWD